MKKANPKTVGGFVIGAVLLAVAAVAVFGGGRFFEARRTIVAFFPGSLIGLRIGAPVEMRGIQIGTVTDIWVEVAKDKLEFTIPVLMEIELSRIRGATEFEEQEPGERLRQLVAKGMRAQLAAQSLVTGQQSIQIDFHPDTPANLVETDIDHPQMPTIPSKFEQVESSVEDLAQQAGVILAEVGDLLSQENRAYIGETLKNVSELTGILNEAVAELTATIKDNRGRVEGLLATGNDTLLAYKAVAERADGILASNQDGIEKAVSGLNAIESSVEALAGKANSMLDENRRGLRDFTNSGLYELSNLAVDAQAAVEQFRRVMEEMERDPARFFLGESGQVEVD